MGRSIGRVGGNRDPKKSQNPWNWMMKMANMVLADVSETDIFTKQPSGGGTLGVRRTRYAPLQARSN